jgi:hypothetical protein
VVNDTELRFPDVTATLMPLMTVGMGMGMGNIFGGSPAMMDAPLDLTEPPALVVPPEAFEETPVAPEPPAAQ